jgi:hypothetical protein
MRAGNVALGCRSVAVDPLELLLIVHGTDGGADLKRTMKQGIMLAGEVGEELRGPGTAVAVRLCEVLANRKAARRGDGDKEVVRDAVLQVVLILNALKSVLSFRYLVLAFKRCAGATQRRWQAKIAAMQRDDLRSRGWRHGQFTITEAGAKVGVAAEHGIAGLRGAAARSGVY